MGAPGGRAEERRRGPRHGASRVEALERGPVCARSLDTRGRFVGGVGGGCGL